MQTYINRAQLYLRLNERYPPRFNLIVYGDERAYANNCTPAKSSCWISCKSQRNNN